MPFDGTVLRRARKAKSWTLERLAKESGLSRQQIAKIERGETHLSRVVACKLRAVLDDIGFLVEFCDACPVRKTLADALGVAVSADNDSALLEQLLQASERIYAELALLQADRPDPSSVEYIVHISEVKKSLAKMRNLSTAVANMYGRKPI